jgi:hypothetical protein
LHYGSNNIRLSFLSCLWLCVKFCYFWHPYTETCNLRWFEGAIIIALITTINYVVLGKCRLQLCMSSSWLVIIALIFVIDVCWLPKLIHMLMLIYCGVPVLFGWVVQILMAMYSLGNFVMLVIAEYSCNWASGRHGTIGPALPSARHGPIWPRSCRAWAQAAARGPARHGPIDDSCRAWPGTICAVPGPPRAVLARPALLDIYT